MEVFILTISGWLVVRTKKHHTCTGVKAKLEVRPEVAPPLGPLPKWLSLNLKNIAIK